MKSRVVLLFLFATSFIIDGEFNNEPLAFVTVTIKGASDKVSTNLNGEYTLKINPGTNTLVFDFAGYESK